MFIPYFEAQTNLFVRNGILCKILKKMRASKILLKNDKQKNEKEFEIVKEFLTRLQYNPTSITHPECPDFDVEIADKIIGIEITEYYADASLKGSNIKRLFSEWTKFAKKIKKELKKNDAEYEYIYGILSFDSNVDKFRFLKDKGCFNKLLLLVEILIE